MSPAGDFSGGGRFYRMSFAVIIIVIISADERNDWRR